MCVAKVATPQVTAELAPGPSGPRVRLKVAVPRDGEVSLVTFIRIRYKVPGGAWKILAPRTAGTSKVNHFTTEVGEEHGLEVEKSYIFAMQFLAPKRRSQWSSETAAMSLQSPQLPVLADAKLTVSAKRTTSVTISWPELQVPVIFASLEFRLDVYQILEDCQEHRTSVLVEADDEATPFEVPQETSSLMRSCMRHCGIVM